ncbi:sulfatase-like hydrolase/transferase [Shimia abyssi]|uniref:Arylsulfatase A-like enzyme n=1 Tax=Shimia abyssi TaxID=1662395 RepID=A0A2P8FDD4_9RHOB|nr:sulfatase-like hydrolase/transferase [Shimia abyssi]PSL19729.1 arylsulfatase A-like enzyme [Shimia abyssi]
MARKNILFIMCDQLRFDYLGCAGHPSIKTPNIDALAARGVQFSNAYCQSPICGPSRMSVYTGRYVSSNGAHSNFAPLRIGERNIGHHLNPLGVRTVLVGKTHMKPDTEGMQRLGIDPESDIGVNHAQAGFEAYERDDGIHPDTMVRPGLPYNEYLKSKGYGEDSNPWHWAANSVETEQGVRSGFFNDRVDLAARVSDEDSETPYMTRRAMDFLAEDDGETPWLLHLSYIKPHWPYVAPAPYNDMYSADDVIPAVKSDAELEDTNPLMKHFMERVAGKTFGRDEAREKVIPVYMGLITQIDDQLGILFDFMQQRDLLENTMIVFTSDHGDYMGDHWMGDKDYFHNPSVKVPLIISDPQSEADATRGTTDASLVELIDLLPTFVEYYGGEIPYNILEGRSLLPKLHGDTPEWRDFVISEYDYSCQVFRPETGKEPLECRSYMVATKDWKYVHAPGYPPVLFDLKNDPDEMTDLGRNPDHEDIRQSMFKRLGNWSLHYRQRETWSEPHNIKMTGMEEKLGVLIGYWDENDAKGKDPKILPRRKPNTTT